MSPLRALWLASTLAAGFLSACGTTTPQDESPLKPISYGELAGAPIAPSDARIAYGTDALQFGDIRLPGGTGPVPVVVLIHGGCWLAEYNLDHVSQASARLAREGFATWTVEYRRVGDPGGGWPGTFADIGAAVDAVRMLKSRYPRLDTTKVVLVGHSAGGHLALYAASRRAGETLDGVPVGSAPLHVAGVVSLAGITDLRTYGATRGSCNDAVPQLLGGTPTDVPARYEAVDPIQRVPLGVPVRLVHGAVDPIVPVDQSQSFVARQVGTGGVAELTLVPDAGHFDLVAPTRPAFDAVVAAVRQLVGTR